MIRGPTRQRWLNTFKPELLKIKLIYKNIDLLISS
jgi:hypothetical protein